MNWIHRYVKSVENHLPTSMRDEVGEELTSLLEDEWEHAKEGHADTDEGLKAWIEAKEHPFIAANKYLPQQSLVGAELFPLYKHVLKYFLIITGVVYGLLWTLKAVLVQSSYSIPSIIWNISGEYLETIVFGIFVITLIFHFSGNLWKSKDWFKNWKIESLPRTNQRWEHIPYFDSIVAFLVSIAVATVLGNLSVGLNMPFEEHVPAFMRWGNIDGMSQFENTSFIFNDRAKIGLMVVIGTLIAYAILQIKHWISPRWTIGKLIENIIINIVFIAAIVSVIGTDFILIAPEQSLEHAERLPELLKFINRTINISAAIFALVSVYEVGRDLIRISKLARCRS